MVDSVRMPYSRTASRRFHSEQAKCLIHAKRHNRPAVILGYTPTPHLCLTLFLSG